MDISIILSTYNRLQVLDITLDSFTRLDIGNIKWEIILIDNANDVLTHSVANKYKSILPLKLLIEKLRGKNNALKKGIKAAEGELYVFTDDDIIAESSWLKEMYAGAQRWPNYSIFGGRILPKFPPGRVLLAPDNPFYVAAYAKADWNVKEGPYSADKVWGANMAVRSKIFHSGWNYNTNIGPSGKNYISGSESEFTLRLEKAGFRSVYLPRSTVHHIIRPQQLKAKWLYGRAFRAGRMSTYLNFGQFSNLPGTRGLAFSLVREIIKIGIKRAIYFLDRDKHINLGIKYWKLIGQMYEMIKKVD